MKTLYLAVFLSIITFPIFIITLHGQNFAEGRLLLVPSDTTALPDDTVNIWTGNAIVDTIFSTYDVEVYSNAFPSTGVLKLDDVYLLQCDCDEDSIKAALEETALFNNVERIPYWASAYTPNDYSIGNCGSNVSWHLDAINAENAWDNSTGSTSVRVAIIDNGFYDNHEDLNGQIYDTRHHITSPYVGFGTGLTYNSPHGTGMATLASGATDNNKGIASIGFNTKLILYDVGASALDPNGVRYNDAYLILNAILDIAYQEEADIISMSFIFEYNYFYGELMRSVVNYAYQEGLFLVAAAGNATLSGLRPATFKYVPASFNSVFSVTQHNESEELAGSSTQPWANYNEEVDLIAPGAYIRTGEEVDGSGVSTYDCTIGSSNATAIVAGTAALMLSANANLTPCDIRYILRATANDDIISNNSTEPYANLIGTGRLDAEAAVDMASGFILSDADQTVTGQVTLPVASYIDEEIIIEDGGELTITGQLYMGDGAKIIVEQGGTLNIENADVTNLCEEYTWKGIQILRDHSNGLGTTSISLSNVKFRNSENGIYTGQVQPGIGGKLLGSIDIDDCYFTNNLESIHINDHIYKFGGKYDVDIDNTQFLSTVGGKEFADLNSSTWTKFINCNLSIIDCKFSDEFIDQIIGGSNLTRESTGIYYSGAGIPMGYECSIQASEFSWLRKGIETRGGSPYNTLIYYSDFKRCHQGVKHSKSIGSFIIGNTFDIHYDPTLLKPNSTQLDSCYGIVTYGASSPTIQNNTFSAFWNGQVGNGLGYNLLVENSGAQDGYVFDNTFTNQNILGIQVQGVNPGLKIRCNDFNKAYNINESWLNIPVNGKGSLRNQGNPGCLTHSQHAAGNKWSNLCTGSSESDIYVDDVSLYDFDYWHHKGDYPLQNATTQPDCSTNNWKAFPHLLDCNIYEAANSCAGIGPGIIDTGSYENFRTVAEDWQEAYQDSIADYVSTLEGGTLNDSAQAVVRSLITEVKWDLQWLESIMIRRMLNEDPNNVSFAPFTTSTGRILAFCYAYTEGDTIADILSGFEADTFLMDSAYLADFLMFAEVLASSTDTTRDTFYLTSEEQSDLETVAGNQNGMERFAQGLLEEALDTTYPYFILPKSGSGKRGPQTEELPEPFLQVFPNPANNTLYLRQAGMDGGVFYLYNLNGQLMNWQTLTDSEVTQVNIGGLSPGLYIYNIQLPDETGSPSGKVIILPE